jgi:hypothetical protein
MSDWWEREVTPDEERAIREFMTRLAAEPLPGDGPASAGVTWWRAELLRRWDEERTIQAPLDVMEPVQIAAGLAAAGLVLAWSLPFIIGALARVTG